MRPSHPFAESLCQGVYLQNQNVLLPWGATRQSLKTLNVPYTERETADRWELQWSDCRVMDGLELQLSATFFKAATYRDTILRRVACNHLNDGSFDSAKAKYDEMLAHISALFGQPTEKSEDAATWICCEGESAVNLFIWERHGWFCAISFSKEPYAP